MFALEAQLAIGVVFHHQQLVADQSLCQCLAVGTAVGDAARVLEVGHAVQQLGVGAARQQRIQRRQIQPLFTQGNGLEGRLIDGEGLDGAEIARLLDDEILPLVDQHLAQQIQRLLGAAGDEDVVRIDLHAVAGQIAVGDVLAQRAKPSVAAYCRAAAPCSRSTSWQAWSMALTGNRCGLGRPPAKEMISGLAATLRISRMKEGSTFSKRWAKTAA